MNTRNTRRILTAAVAAGALLGVVWGFAASPAASAPNGVRVVKIVMKDPGCHWFLVNGKDKARLTVHGKTAFQNLDEAALKFKGAGYFHKVPVGKTVAISKKGVYKIKMVGQPSDDNTLVLTVK